MKRLAVLSTLVFLVLIAAACAPSGTPFPAEYVPADPGNPASVVNAFFTARSAFNLDAAMQYVNDSTVIVNPRGTHTGVDQIREMVQSMMDENFQFEITSSQTNGDQVTFKMQAYQNGQAVEMVNGQAVVQGGVIASMTLEVE
ncbi:MAG: nuclear transport factor 2 family protein [Chloroflexota bacterium]|nr:nuclear transport factor 2 family protein [Chloroflexota bacterium]